MKGRVSILRTENSTDNYRQLGDDQAKKAWDNFILTG